MTATLTSSARINLLHRARGALTHRSFCLDFWRRSGRSKQTWPALCLFMILMALSMAAVAAPTTMGKDVPYSVLKDASGALSLEDALQALEDVVPTETGPLSRGYVRDTFWLRFDLPASAFDQAERWLELGPTFVDDIRLFYRPKGSDAPWHLRHTGDLMVGKADLDYRTPVFIVPPPPTPAGYEVVIRVQTTSTVLLYANLWKPVEFFGSAARSTSFWSFYFGLAAISSLLALVLAITLRHRLLWATAAFSLAYLFVASVQGYVNWTFSGMDFPLQHYITGALTLISFALLMWLCTETINLRQHLPWAHKTLMAACGVTLSLVALIPFGHYGTALKIKVVIFMLTSILFTYAVFHVWARDRFRLSTLLLGTSPMVCIIASLFGLFSIFGWVPFSNEIYFVWQYALVINMLLVIAIAVYQVREKKLEELKKQQLAQELRAERNATFHQRQFIGMVSHEFRTPLAVIAGSIESLYQLEGSDNNKRSYRYDKIQRETDRLIQLTDNCLADARLSVDTLYLDPQFADLLELVSSAASLVQFSDSHQLALTAHGRPLSASPGPWPVWVDTALTRIALSNVIDNAVKYSAAGTTIRIDCSLHAQWASIRITDQGPGVGEQAGEQIFERYRRGTRVRQGSGLGLHVARQIARAQGGDLRLVSSSPQGSCFEFTLPPTETPSARESTSPFNTQPGFTANG